MRALLPVLLTVFLDLVGFGIVIPLLPYFAREYGASGLHVTLLMAVYSLAQFLMAPVWGGLAARYGRRPIMLVSVAATAIFLAAFASSTSLWMLFVFRALHGVATANISTAQAAVADLTEGKDRAMGMGMIGAAFGVGFSLGPWMGGELAVYGLSTPIWVAAGLSVINFVMTWFLLPETRKPGAAAAGHTRSVNPGAFVQVARHAVVGPAVVLTFVMTAAFALMESTFGVFAADVHQLSPAQLGRMFGAAGLTGIIVQGGLIRPLARRFGEGPLVRVGIALLASGLALLPYADPDGSMVAVFILISIGQGLTTPNLYSLISRHTSPDEQGFVLGTNQSMSALARVVGPTVGGLLYTHISPRSPFQVSALVLVGGLGLAFYALRRLGPTPSA